MGNLIIENGAGDGAKMKVDGDNRAHIQSLSIIYEDFAVLNGDSFAAQSGTVTLTTANVSYLLYVKNDNSHDIVISNLLSAKGTSTGGTTTDWFTVLQINPSGGTLITGAVPGFAINNNLGSPKTLDITVFTGVEGTTATGGIPIQLLSQGPSSTFLGQKIVVPPGSSFALGLIPPPGNTSALASLSTTLIKQTLDIT